MSYKILLLGPATSGKGTQAKLLSKKLNIPALSTGQLLRDEIHKKSDIGQQVESYINQGQLAPNEITNKLVEQRINEEDCKNGFIFDGFPRHIEQAEFLDKIINITHVFNLNVSDETVIARLSGRRTCAKCKQIYHLEFDPPQQENVCDKCGGDLIQRDDDTPQAIKIRLDIFHSDTQKVIKHYQDKGVLIQIDGEPSIEKVRDEIFSKLDV